MSRLQWFLGSLLMVYLLGIGVTGGILTAYNFPVLADNKIEFPNILPTQTSAANEEANAAAPRKDYGEFYPFGRLSSPDQGLVLLALVAGITGSFLHASQSLVTFMGNAALKLSWIPWYVMRPWIGGILGMAVYVVFRAGLVVGADSANPYGVVSLGLLGGWFSKTTTDKLQEVFETLFKTNEDTKRKDKAHNPADG